MVVNLSMDCWCSLIQSEREDMGGMLDRACLYIKNVELSQGTEPRPACRGYAAMAMGLNKARVSSSWASASFNRAGRSLSLNWVAWSA